MSSFHLDESASKIPFGCFRFMITITMLPILSVEFFFSNHTRLLDLDPGLHYGNGSIIADSGSVCWHLIRLSTLRNQCGRASLFISPSVHHSRKNRILSSCSQANAFFLSFWVFRTTERLQIPVLYSIHIGNEKFYLLYEVCCGIFTP